MPSSARYSSCPSACAVPIDDAHVVVLGGKVAEDLVVGILQIKGAADGNKIERLSAPRRQRAPVPWTCRESVHLFPAQTPQRRGRTRWRHLARRRLVPQKAGGSPCHRHRRRAGIAAARARLPRLPSHRYREPWRCRCPCWGRMPSGWGRDFRHNLGCGFRAFVLFLLLFCVGLLCVCFGGCLLLGRRVCLRKLGA